MNREEALDFLVNEVSFWSGGGFGGCGWRFEDSVFCHQEHAAITIDDWNRAKIKPNTKIRILSEEHSKYVQVLALDVGFKWSDGDDCCKYTEEPFLFFTGGKIDCMPKSKEKSFEKYSGKEIFIEMPKSKENNSEWVMVGEPREGFPFFAVKFEESEKEEPTNINAKVLAEKVGGKHSHYFKDVSDLDEVDVYRVCDLFEVNDPSGAKQHAIKKLLCSGQRGAKDEQKDLEEARDTIIRKLEMMGEDSQ